jgi:ATP-dependent Zn protease
MALPGTDPVQKISIIPRGVAALGYTLQRPTEDRFLMTREELENKMAVLLGGRAAEEVVFDHLSTGAANDLAKVTEIARSMVMRYAMVKSLGHVAYEEERLPAARRRAAIASTAKRPLARSMSPCARSSMAPTRRRFRFSAASVRCSSGGR